MGLTRLTLSFVNAQAVRTDNWKLPTCYCKGQTRCFRGKRENTFHDHLDGAGTGTVQNAELQKTMPYPYQMHYSAADEATPHVEVAYAHIPST